MLPLLSYGTADYSNLKPSDARIPNVFFQSLGLSLPYLRPSYFLPTVRYVLPTTCLPVDFIHVPKVSKCVSNPIYIGCTYLR